MSEHTAALPACSAARLAAARDRVGSGRVAHLTKHEQARQRRQPPIDCPRRVADVAPVSDQEHILAVLIAQHLRPTCHQVAQQHIGLDRVKRDVLADHPPREMQQVIRVRADCQRRVVARRQVPQKVVGQVQAVKPGAREEPLIATAFDSKPVIYLGHLHRSSARLGRDPAPADARALAASALAYGSLRSDERGHHLIADAAATHVGGARLISRIKVGISTPAARASSNYAPGCMSCFCPVTARR